MSATRLMQNCVMKVKLGFEKVQNIHDLKEGDPDRRLQLCEFMRQFQEKTKFFSTFCVFRLW